MVRGSGVIYGLLDPVTLELRYIGKTHDAKTRWRYHVAPSRARERTKRGSWLNSLMKRGLKPVFVVLEDNVSDANVAEIKWIAEMRGLGARLVNGTNGGDGRALNAPCSQRTREKLSKASRGKRRSPIVIEALATFDKDAFQKTKSRKNTIGVSFVKRANKWRAYFYSKGSQIHIGYFTTELEARQAYLQATQ